MTGMALAALSVSTESANSQSVDSSDQERKKKTRNDDWGKKDFSKDLQKIQSL